jgi:hypothetical protein
VLPALLGELLKRDGVVRGGAAVFDDGGSGFRPQAYVQDLEMARLRREFRVDGGGEDPNVLLRVVPHAVWPFDPLQSVVWPVVGFVDLVDEREERWVRDRLATVRLSDATAGN